MAKENENLAFVFPGQGSQQVGMLQEISTQFPIIKQTFQEASDALGMDLWELVQHGPQQQLNMTMHTQPALLTASVALYRAWQSQQGPLAKYLAGHSLGEYSALVCADAISLEEGVKLVALRGKLMQEAVPEGTGAMAAIIGGDDSMIESACRDAAEDQVVAPVNFNAIGQTVIAGNKSAVERACALVKDKGAKKVVMLPVSVPSHCALMRDAAKNLEKALASVKIATPKFPIFHNVDVDVCSEPEGIRERLVKQLYCPVRWVGIIQRLAKEGVHTVIECGPGKVLCGLIKRIESQVVAMPIETSQEFQTALAKFQ